MILVEKMDSILWRQTQMRHEFDVCNLERTANRSTWNHHFSIQDRFYNKKITHTEKRERFMFLLKCFLRYSPFLGWIQFSKVYIVVEVHVYPIVFHKCDYILPSPTENRYCCPSSPPLEFLEMELQSVSFDWKNDWISALNCILALNAVLQWYWRVGECGRRPTLI
jgi:hypothetical protein